METKADSHLHLSFPYIYLEMKYMWQSAPKLSFISRPSQVSRDDQSIDACRAMKNMTNCDIDYDNYDE